MDGIRVTPRVDERAARLAIHELVARYNMAWDVGDAEGVMDCFTEDGSFVAATGTEHVGRDAIGAFVTLTRERYGRMRHITSTHLMTGLTDVAASHRCYVVLASHLDGERQLDTGEYDDLLRLGQDGWRFVRRVVRYD